MMSTSNHRPPPKGVQVMTLRVPADVHAAIRRLAHRRKLSMNQFCVEALSQASSTNPSKKAS